MAELIDTMCLEAAFRMLSGKDRFSAEIRTALEKKGFGSEDIEPVILHLIRRTLVDDKRSTQNLIARMTGKRAAGTEKLRAELQKRGAPEEIIEECLGEISPTDQPQAMIEALSAKFKPTDDRARAARFLLGRGFAEDEIEGPLNEFFGTD